MYTKDCYSRTPPSLTRLSWNPCYLELIHEIIFPWTCSLSLLSAILDPWHLDGYLSTTATPLWQPLFCCQLTVVHTFTLLYKGHLSTMAHPLKLIQTAKITSWRWPANQWLLNSVYKTPFVLSLSVNVIDTFLIYMINKISNFFFF